jgi:basic membrane protein A
VAPLVAVVAVLAALTQPAAAPAAPTSLRIGMVANTAGVFDRSFNQLAYAGVRTAAARLRARIDVRASPSEASYVPSLRAMAAQGYDLVIAIGAPEEGAVGEVARQYPKVNFAIVDDSYASPGIGGLANVQGLLFKEQEAGYLAGYLAGLMQATSGPRMRAGKVVSSVGGAKEPSVDRYIAGFQAGVKAADPKVKLLNAYATPGALVTRCQSLAASQIAAGSDIVFQVAGPCGIGALTEVNAKNVWAIGSDADQGFLGPYVLASAVKRVDRVVILAIDAVADGTFKGGRDVVFGIAQNAVGVAGINALVPRPIRVKLAAVAASMRAGKISIPTTVARALSR